MPFDRTKIQRPSWDMGPKPLMRFMILLANILTIILFIIALGLYYGWSPYQSEWLLDWNDPLMIFVLLISLIWTAFINIRPAWTPKPLHPGHYVAWELICWLIILGCGISAALISDLLDVLDIDEQDNHCSSERMREYRYGSSWRREPRILSLQKLEITCLTFAFVIAIFHFVLFVMACRDCERHNKGKKTMLRIESEVELVGPK